MLIKRLFDCLIAALHAGFLGAAAGFVLGNLFPFFGHGIGLAIGGVAGFLLGLFLEIFFPELVWGGLIGSFLATATVLTLTSSLFAVSLAPWLCLTLIIGSAALGSALGATLGHNYIPKSQAEWEHPLTAAIYPSSYDKDPKVTAIKERRKQYTQTGEYPYSVPTYQK